MLGGHQYLQRAHAAERRVNELLIEVHNKDMMLANLHSELVSDLDSGSKSSGSRKTRPRLNSERSCKTLKDSHVANCMELLCVRDEESMLESISSLQRELFQAKNQCASMTKIAFDLQSEIEMIAKPTQSIESLSQRISKVLREDEIQSAFETALQLQEENNFLKSAFQNLGVSKFEDATSAVNALVSKQQEINVSRSEMQVTIDVLTDRIRGLEHLISIAAREHDLMEEKIGDLQGSLLHANQEQTKLLEIIQQLENELAGIEIEHQKQISSWKIDVTCRDELIEAHSKSKQAADLKAAARKQEVLRRVCNSWVHRWLLQAFARWIQFGEQRKRAKYICIKVIKRIQNLKEACFIDAWVATVHARKRLKGLCGKALHRIKSVYLSKIVDAWSWKVKRTIRHNLFASSSLNKIRQNAGIRLIRNWYHVAKELREERVHTERRQAADLKEAARKQEVLRRVCNSWVHRRLLQAFARWIQFGEQRKQAKYICIKVIKRIQNLKEACFIDAWVATVHARKRLKGLCGKALHRMTSVKMAFFFSCWAKNLTRAQLAYQVAQADSLALKIKEITETNCRFCAELDAVRLEFIKLKFERDQFEIDCISKEDGIHKANLDLSKLQDEHKMSQERHLYDFERQSNMFQENIKKLAENSEIHIARNLQIDQELNHLKRVNTELMDAHEDQKLRFLALLHSQNDLQAQNVTLEARLNSKLDDETQNNHGFLNRTRELEQSICQKENTILDLTTKLTELEQNFATSGAIIQKLQSEITGHSTSMICLIQEFCGDEAMTTQNFNESRLEEIRTCIRHNWSICKDELKEVKNLLERVESECLLNTSQHKSLKDRYISDCKILQMRLEEQSHVVNHTKAECSRLECLYEQDMHEVCCLTGVLQNSIASLQGTLAQKQQQLQLLLRSELLEILCSVASGSRSATRLELVTAFWNEKPETRAHLSEWFSELQTNESRRIQSLEQQLSTLKASKQTF